VNTGDLSGKAVAVTGAGSGIGRETALAFARRGADLEICDLNEEAVAATAEEIGKIGRGRATSAVVDVADAERMQAWADAVHLRVHALDILVNNAGFRTSKRRTDASALTIGRSVLRAQRS
jgi:NAD(P)-dependent dehydrogenase (short-subunit alcohol dehydrogenase family)